MYIINDIYLKARIISKPSATKGWCLVKLAMAIALPILLCRYEKSGNQELSESLTSWVFKQKGVLRVGKVEHHKKGEKQAPEEYTVMEDVVCLMIPIMEIDIRRLKVITHTHAMIITLYCKI